jgi:hypothetical protein
MESVQQTMKFQLLKKIERGFFSMTVKYVFCPYIAIRIYVGQGYWICFKSTEVDTER